MGAGNLAGITASLIEGGRAPDTPVAAVRWGTHARAAHDPDHVGRGARRRHPRPRARSSSARSPALDLAWFETRPLFGRTIVITRAREQASSAAHPARVARRRGGRAAGDRDRADRLRRCRRSAGTRGSCSPRRTASTRSSTAASARPVSTPARSAGCRSRRSARAPRPRSSQRGIRADLVPERYVAESLVDAFPLRDGRERTRAARPGRAGARRPARRPRRPRLPGRRARGLPDRRRPSPTPTHLERVRKGLVDAVTFTASSTVTGFCDLVGDLPDPQPLVVSIGPITSRTARDRGLRVDAEADPHTIDGVVDALLAEIARRTGLTSRTEPAGCVPRREAVQLSRSTSGRSGRLRLAGVVERPTPTHVMSGEAAQPDARGTSVRTRGSARSSLCRSSFATGVRLTTS